MWCQHFRRIMVDWPEAGTPVRLVVKTWSGETTHEGLSLPRVLVCTTGYIELSKALARVLSTGSNLLIRRTWYGYSTSTCTRYSGRVLVRYRYITVAPGLYYREQLCVAWVNYLYGSAVRQCGTKDL